MKHILITPLLFLSLLSFAQPQGFHPDMISDDEFIRMQTTDIAMWLNLQGHTKEQFITQYSSFRKEIDAVARTAFRPRDDETQSESSIEKALLNSFEVSEKILGIRKQYFYIFRKFMEPSQIRLMYHLENESGKRMHNQPAPPARPDGPGMPPMPPRYPQDNPGAPEFDFMR